MTDKLHPILVSYTLKTASWDHAVSTEVNAHQIILVPDLMMTDAYIQTPDFFNRALYLISSKQHSDENSHSAYTVDVDGKEIELTVFHLNENDFKKTINVTDDLGYLSGHTASYYDEYKEEGLVQITVDIHLHNIRQISESECDFLKSICTPIDEINLNPLFGILKVKDEFEN